MAHDITAARAQVIGGEKWIAKIEAAGDSAAGCSRRLSHCC
jgi:hypothetical protein